MDQVLRSSLKLRKTIEHGSAYRIKVKCSPAAQDA